MRKRTKYNSTEGALKFMLGRRLLTVYKGYTTYPHKGGFWKKKKRTRKDRDLLLQELAQKLQEYCAYREKVWQKIVEMAPELGEIKI